MKAKYIIVNMKDSELPFVFPDCINHDEFAFTQGGRSRVVGAGFCHITDEGDWEAFGESRSLNIKSRPKDSDILNCYLRG